MATRADITPELLRQLLRYEPETGKLFWKERFSEKKSVNGSVIAFNKRFSDKEIYTRVGLSTYLEFKLRINKYEFRMLAHRVAWALYYGEWPKDYIDHINHNKHDNEIANLREVTISQNNKNRPKQKNNTSGYTGIIKRKDKWESRVKNNGKVHYLGIFETINDALKVRNKAIQELSFHPNHGIN